MSVVMIIRIRSTMMEEGRITSLVQEALDRQRDQLTDIDVEVLTEKRT